MSIFKNNLNVVKDLQIFSVTSQLMNADGQKKREPYNHITVQKTKISRVK